MNILNPNVVTNHQVARITSQSSKPIREAIGAIAQTVTGTAVLAKQITDYANIALAREIDGLLEDITQPEQATVVTDVEKPVMSNAEVIAMAKEFQALREAQAQS